MATALNDLVEILRLAYSGALAAAYAYRGHWHSVKDEPTRRRIREIEEEWHHRRLVGQMLEKVGARPGRLRELAGDCHWQNSGRALSHERPVIADVRGRQTGGSEHPRG